MSEPQAGQVQLKYTLLVTPKEARALVALCSQGILPVEFPLGITSKLGSALKILMKAHGLIASEGKGRGAVSRPNPSAFDEVWFRVSDTLRPKQPRWTEIPSHLRKWREPYAWLQELETVLRREVRPSAPRPEVRPREGSTLTLPSPLEGEGKGEGAPDLSGALGFLLRHHARVLKELAQHRETHKDIFVRAEALEAEGASIAAAITELEKAKACLGSTT